jgi:hypothetical protein
MKRAVFISILSLLGIHSWGRLSAEYIYLTSVTHCNALCVSSKDILLIVPKKESSKPKLLKQISIT